MIKNLIKFLVENYCAKKPVNDEHVKFLKFEIYIKYFLFENLTSIIINKVSKKRTQLKKREETLFIS